MGQDRKRVWTIALVGVSAIASVVIVIGLATAPDDGAQVSLPTLTTTAEPPEPTTGVVVTPSVAFPTQIPGCDTVEAPSERAYSGWVSVGQASYGNSKYPWFSGPKATAMSDGLRAALPATVELQFASPTQSLTFDPISVPDESQSSTPVEDFGGDTTASGTIIRDGAVGNLFVTIRQSTTPPGACVAGDIDRRSTLADGTVVDSQDTWSEYNGHRSLSRRVTAYIPDGTLIYATASDGNSAESDPAKRNSGTVPLTIDELVAIVTTPALRVTTPVPPGTPAPPESCSFGNESGPDFTREDVQRLNTALNSYWDKRTPDGVTLDRPLGSLQLADYGRSIACESLHASAPGTSGGLSISIMGGQELPKEPDPYAPSLIERPDQRITLPDGTVMDRKSGSATVSAEPGAIAVQSDSLTVTVTRPSGTEIRISTTSETLPPFTFEQLEAIATASGLEL